MARIPPRWSGARRSVSPVEAAEAALAAVAVADRPPQVLRTERGEGPRLEDQLAVGQLPHQRWRQSRRRPEHDHEVRLDVGWLVEHAGDRLLVDRRADGQVA